MQKKYILEQSSQKNNKNPKKTWETLNKLLKHKNTCSTLPSQSDNPEQTGLMAERFNSFFAEIGKTLKQNIDASNTDPLQNIVRAEEDITCFSLVNDNDVEKIIIQLKDVGAGIDGVNSKIFKSTYKPILTKLTYFFNLCLSTGTFPKPLKVAILKPIFKSGDSDCLSNYRPISILPIMSKILEKIIYYQMSDFITKRNILSNCQFGFRRNNSTYMPIMLIQDYITKALENDDLVVGIYLDLTKAFDTVDHEILIKKLHKIGFQGTALSMLKSYLMERFQTVQINEIKSTFREVKMGVPQGSILGPLLFILYINDITNLNIEGQIMLYADDTALFFKHKNPEALQHITNTALSKIACWLESNYLTLNTSKTFLQIYTKRKSVETLEIYINGNAIKEVKTIKYLGVLMDSDLKFTSHISTVCNTVSRNIGMIARARPFLTKKLLIQLYNSIVFPYINYCCFIWGSNYDERLRKLVTLQKRSMRLIEGIFPPQSATPVFKEYNILKVKEVAHLQILLIMHKYLLQELPSALGHLVQLCPEPTHLTRRSDHFQIPFSKKNCRLFTFACTGPKLWNNLIAANFLLNEVPRSKVALKRYLKHIFVNNY